MPFFTNVFDAEFMGSLLLSDRQYNITFKVKGNLPNSSQLFQSWNAAPYDVASPNNNLTLNYSFDSGNSWTILTIDVSTVAVNANAAMAYEVVAALNANATFQALFTASVNQDNKGNTYVAVVSSRSRERFKVYVTNGSAESILRFNKRAGVAELPTYMARHTIANKSIYHDSVGMLIQLDPTTTRDQQIIQEAGLAHPVGVSNSSETLSIGNTAPFAVGDSVIVYYNGNYQSQIISSISANVSLTLDADWTNGTGNGQLIDVHADYQLLRGRSGLFNFQNITIDGSDRITKIIEYPAGALPGDLAKVIQYVYSSSNTNPSQITEFPYTLTTTDLVLP